MVRLRPCLSGLALLVLLTAAPAMAQIAALAGLQLQDHRGQAVNAGVLAGRPVLLHFVFTGCGSTCPLQVQELLQLRQALGSQVAARVQFVAVTVDPVADTPAALAGFARRMQADLPGWRFVTGAPVQVERFNDRMQVFAAKGPAASAGGVTPANAITTVAARPAQASPRPDDHRTALYLFAADGRLLQRFRGVPVDVPRLAAEIRAEAHAAAGTPAGTAQPARPPAPRQP